MTGTKLWKSYIFLQWRYSSLCLQWYLLPLAHLMTMKHRRQRTSKPILLVSGNLPTSLDGNMIIPKMILSKLTKIFQKSKVSVCYLKVMIPIKKYWYSGISGWYSPGYTCNKYEVSGNKIILYTSSGTIEETVNVVLIKGDVVIFETTLEEGPQYKQRITYKRIN